MAALYNIIYDSTNNKLVIQDIFTVDQSGDYEGQPTAVADPSFDPTATYVQSGNATTVGVAVTNCDGTSTSSFTVQASDWTNPVGGPWSTSASGYSQYGGNGIANNDLQIDLPTISGMNVWTVTLTITYSGTLDGEAITDQADIYIESFFIDIDNTCKCKIYEKSLEEKKYSDIVLYEAIQNVNDCVSLRNDACDVLKCLQTSCNNAANCNC